MRKESVVVQVILALGVLACSEPECRDDETKVGKVCYPNPEREGVDAEAGDDTRVDGGLPDAAMTGRDRDEEPYAEAGRPDAGDRGNEVDGGCTSSPCMPTCIPTPEVCDQKDNDCDGKADEDIACAPGCVASAEVCDGKDNDCDGQTDEDAPTWYRDCDNDGAPVLLGAQKSCTKPTLSGCLNFLEQMPVTADCNDGDARYYPGAIPKVTSNGPNELEEQKYAGDMNCDGVVQKPKSWDYYNEGTGAWVAASYPLCSGTESCSVGGQPCYSNMEQAGQPLGCGNTEILIQTFDACAGTIYIARLVCQ